MEPLDLPFTYRKLREELNKLSEEQLDQEVMLFPPQMDQTVPIRLEPALELGTVEKMCSSEDGKACTETRSTKDFKHHPEQLVILRDKSPYSKDGDMAYDVDMESGKFRGVQSGKEFSWNDLDYDDEDDWEVEEIEEFREPTEEYDVEEGG